MIRDREDLEQAFRQLRRESKCLSAPPHVEASIGAQFRARYRRPSNLRYWLAAGIAAIVLVAAGTLLPRPKPAPVAHQPPAPKPVPQPAPAPQVVIAKAPPKIRRVRPVPASSPPQPEYATDFVALTPLPPPDIAETAQIVRVRIPRRELQRFGLIPLGRPDQSMVPADVVLGQDGMARAIRLVSTR